MKPRKMAGKNSHFRNKPDNISTTVTAKNKQINLALLLKLSLVKIKTVWRKLGPGLVTGASDDDPSGIATYTKAGAPFGFQTLWTAWISFPLMVSIQEMCGRIGLVTRHGIAGVIKRNYSKKLLYFSNKK